MIGPLRNVFRDGGSLGLQSWRRLEKETRTGDADRTEGRCHDRACLPAAIDSSRVRNPRHPNQPGSLLPSYLLLLDVAGEKRCSNKNSNQGKRTWSSRSHGGGSSSSSSRSISSSSLHAVLVILPTRSIWHWACASVCKYEGANRKQRLRWSRHRLQSVVALE